MGSCDLRRRATPDEASTLEKGWEDNQEVQLLTEQFLADVGEIYGKMHRLALRLLPAMGHQQADVEDIASDMALRAWERVRNGEPVSAAIKWFYWAATDASRKKSNERATARFTDDISPSPEFAEHSDIAERFRHRLESTVSPVDIDAGRLRVEGNEVSEIAKILQLERTAASQRLQRFRRGALSVAESLKMDSNDRSLAYCLKNL